MKASLKRKLQTRILLALSALIVGHIFYGVFQEKFKTWDTRIIDRLFVLRPQVNPIKQHHTDAIVHIDANLYFSRPQHAQIIRNLAAMDVSAQLIDFIFTDQIKRYSPVIITSGAVIRFLELITPQVFLIQHMVFHMNIRCLI